MTDMMRNPVYVYGNDRDELSGAVRAVALLADLIAAKHPGSSTIEQARAILVDLYEELSVRDDKRDSLNPRFFGRIAKLKRPRQ